MEGRVGVPALGDGERDSFGVALAACLWSVGNDPPIPFPTPQKRCDATRRNARYAWSEGVRENGRGLTYAITPTVGV